MSDAFHEPEVCLRIVLPRLYATIKPDQKFEFGEREADQETRLNFRHVEITKIRSVDVVFCRSRTCRGLSIVVSTSACGKKSRTTGVRFAQATATQNFSFFQSPPGKGGHYHPPSASLPTPYSCGENGAGQHA